MEAEALEMGGPQIYASATPSWYKPGNWDLAGPGLPKVKGDRWQSHTF